PLQRLRTVQRYPPVVSQPRADMIRGRLPVLPRGQVGVWLILCEGARSQNAGITAAWPEDLPNAAGSWRRPWAGLLWGGVPGEQRDENLGVRAAPAGDRIPGGSRPVAGDRLGRELHGVVSLGDVVEGLTVAGAAGDLVDGRVDDAQTAPGVLVGQGDQRGPDRCAGAGAAAV